MITTLRKYFVLLPIAYLFVAIFLARSKVQYVYLAAMLTVALAGIAHYRYKLKPERLLANWMIILAAIGLSAAVILSIEKVELLSQPGHVASCSLSPIVACSPVIGSPQASAFGFANSFIGIFGFTAVFTAAMTIAAGAVRLTKAWWRTLFGGITFGAAFCSWLIYQGVFDIGKLCLYCMLVWLVTFALFWLVGSYCVQNKHLNLGKHLNKLFSYKYEAIAITYLVIFFILLFRWADYWRSLL